MTEARPEAQPAVLVTFEQTSSSPESSAASSSTRSGRVVSDGLSVTTHRLAARLRVLREALAQARFATLRRVYRSDTPIADGYVCGIDTPGRTIQVEEGAELPRRRLAPKPFSLLNGLVAQ